MDYVTTNALLNYHYEWLLFDDFPLTWSKNQLLMYRKGTFYWFYALLTLVDTPLNARNWECLGWHIEIESDIRGLYKYILAKRKEWTGSVNVLSYMDILLVITGTYFHQNKWDVCSMEHSEKCSLIALYFCQLLNKHKNPKEDLQESTWLLLDLHIHVVHPLLIHLLSLNPRIGTYLQFEHQNDAILPESHHLHQTILGFTYKLYI